MRLLEIEHPATKTLVDISMRQDAEVGDGTTLVVLLATKILKQVKPFLKEGVHPQIIMRNIQLASRIAVCKVHKFAVLVNVDMPEEEVMLLKTCSNGAELEAHCVPPWSLCANDSWRCTGLIIVGCNYSRDMISVPVYLPSLGPPPFSKIGKWRWRFCQNIWDSLGRYCRCSILYGSKSHPATTRQHSVCNLPLNPSVVQEFLQKSSNIR